ncbi:DUF7151 family protein [Pyxidicoccus trucidator]|uniref:DUF7151 family protein n=1 Tax=Pyxidicoccus trucidator TaxID=2709662 RepID=UPI0013DA72AF|nr:leucine-rich repeat domain-containing protein [Pyxidicoccus trucidator]
MRWTWMVVLALATGCEGIDLEQLVKQHDSLTRVTPEPPGVHCPHGGTVLQGGPDLDDDGVLDDAEVTSTTYSCTTVLTRRREEQAGAHCEHGGQAVQSGVDLDSSGVLEDIEVTTTEYVCATPIPGLLVRSRPVPPGERCPLGGQVTHAGHDTNGDEVLDDGEVTREVYGCTETAPVLARLSVRPFRAFDGCGMDGTTVMAGEDFNGNDALEDSEVRGERGACINLNQARLLQRPEPAGAACVRGGTLVGLGEDLDGNETLDEREVVTRLYVCHPTLTYEGDYRVDDPADLEALRGVSHVRGHLTVEGESVTELVLPGLVAVEGSLRIWMTQALTRVELRGLRFVGGELSINDNGQLETLVVGSDAEDPLLYPVWVGFRLNISSNPRLQTLAGLAPVAPRWSFSLGSNDMLQDPGELPNIMNLEGVSIFKNPALRTLPLPNLQTLSGSLYILDNPSLTSLGSIFRLQSVGGDVNIENNASLRNLTGLRVQSVGGSFSVLSNPLLAELGDVRLKQAGSLRISTNPVLLRVGPIPSLELVRDEFLIQNNPKLTSVEGLPLLRHVKRLFIGDNPLLTGLTGFARLLSLKELDLRQNDALVSLADLKVLRELESLFILRSPELTRLGMDELARVTSLFHVMDNPKLPTCLASTLASAVYHGLPAGRVITGNDDGATCER